ERVNSVFAHTKVSIASVAALSYRMPLRRQNPDVPTGFPRCSRLVVSKPLGRREARTIRTRIFIAVVDVFRPGLSRVVDVPTFRSVNRADVEALFVPMSCADPERRCSASSERVKSRGQV